MNATKPYGDFLARAKIMVFSMVFSMFFVYIRGNFWNHATLHFQQV